MAHPFKLAQVRYIHYTHKVYVDIYIYGNSTDEEGYVNRCCKLITIISIVTTAVSLTKVIMF